MIKKIFMVFLSLFVTTFNQKYTYIGKEINVFKEIPKVNSNKKVINKTINGTKAVSVRGSLFSCGGVLLLGSYMKHYTK